MFKVLEYLLNLSEIDLSHDVAVFQWIMLCNMWSFPMKFIKLAESLFNKFI